MASQRQQQGNDDDKGGFNMIDSGQEFDPPVKDDMFFVSSDEDDQKNFRKNLPDNLNNNEVMEEINDTKVAKNQSKKQLTLQETLDQIQIKLGEKSSIENKISALKTLAQRIKQCKGQSYQNNVLCNWIEAMKLIDNLLHEDSHPQILRNMPMIIKFLYENYRIDKEWINNYTCIGLKAFHDEFTKVIQAFLNFVKIDDLLSVFELIKHETNLQNPNLAAILSTIVSSKAFSEYDINEEIKTHYNNEKEGNILSEELLNEDNYEKRDFFQDQQIKKQKEEPMNEVSKTLTMRLFKFLIEATDTHMNAYYPILNKLITSKHSFLLNQLSTVLSNLLKSGKVNAIWILQHCLKMDFGQSSKQKGSKNQGRFNFILKLVNQHLYQYLLIILARSRFNKVVVDKILNIFILLSKNYKPLDDVYTQYIWKILGLNSREQKQREQFFNFVRDILRNESNFTQQSVYFIFFQVLMSLKAEWFSLKILDCLEMLFMRLNEDLKLISYIDQTYQIQDHDLFGIDKIWYIYFYSNDPKVIKKCKDFLWKLTTYNSSSQVKHKLLKEYVDKIIYYMTQGTPQTKADLCSKGFDMIDKMMEEIQRKQGTVQYVQFSVKNQCSQALAPKIVNLRLPQKYTLSNLREQISLSINPSTTKIKLLLRGQFLKGQKMTLRDLSIENGNTIMVIDDDTSSKPVQQNKELLEQTVSQLQEIFGVEMQKGLLRFIVQKMEGYDAQRIIDAIMNSDKLGTMTSQYHENQFKQKEKQTNNKVIFDTQNPNDEFAIIFDNETMVNKSDENRIQEEHQQVEKSAQPLKFSSILVSQPQCLKQLLFCALETNKKRGWETIKNLPHSSYYISQISNCCEEKNWQSLFPKEQFNEMICIYNAHLLTYILKSDKNKMKRYLLTNGGFGYLVDWVRRLSDKSFSILLEEVTNILVLLLQQDCQLLVQFKKRITKKEETHILPTLIQENLMIMKPKFQQLSTYSEQSFFDWLMNLLLIPQNSIISSSLPITNIAELIIYFLLTNQERLASILNFPNNLIYAIIRAHGFAGEYIFLSAIAKSISTGNEKLQEYFHKLLNLSQFCFNFQSQSPIKSNVVYVYDLIACVMQRETTMTKKQIEVTLKCIQSIKKLTEKIEVQPFIGILNLLKLCVQKLYQEDSIVDEKLNEDLVQFSNWLFKDFLFNISNASKHMRNKNVRKVCYKIIQVVLTKRPGNQMLLFQTILETEVKQRHKEDDYIDFRSQDYIGLTNLGATCYINSLLQQIYHTKFSKLLLEKGDKEQEQLYKMKQLKSIFMQLCYSIKNVVNPKQFIKNLKFYGEPINPCVQQDATQFLLCLFDYIESEGCQSEVYDVFGGYLCNEITVDDPQCDQELIKYNKEHFNSLTIDIKGKKNLQEALAYLIKPQTLDGENKYFCEELGKKMKAYRRCYISKMPNILILTLKRFQFDFDSQSRHKLNDYFEFPLELDMHKYSETFLKNKEENSDSKYKLTGILVHSGSAESGHYYSFIKIGQQWYEFNDKLISEFNIQNNLKNECFGCAEGKKTRSAYMLFYQKINTNYHGVYLNEIPQSNYYKKQINEQNSIFLKTRLVYDENFRNFFETILKHLYNMNPDNMRLEKLMQDIFGKKKKEEEQQQLIFYDADDEREPLIQNQRDLLDQLQSQNPY